MQSLRKFLKRIKLTGMLFNGELAVAHARLYAVHHKANGEQVDLGLIAKHKVTQAFVADLVACLAGTVGSFTAFKYHDCGTGATAEANSQTALVTPFGGSRGVGTQVAGGSGATVTYTSVGTCSFTSALTIIEHGIFNAAAAGTMLDRSTGFSRAVESGDSITFTYVLTVTAES